MVGAILSAHTLLTSAPRPLPTCHRSLKVFEVSPSLFSVSVPGPVTVSVSRAK